MRTENFKRFVPETVSDKHVAFSNEIIRVKSGSEVLGTSIGTGDRDEIGIYIEPPEYVIGFKSMEHFTWRSKPEGERSEPGDIDLTLYSLRKFMGLALQGNPSILNVLYTPEESINYKTSYGEFLLNIADKIVSKRAVPRFLGYLDSQKKRMKGELKGHVPKRPELVDQYGYDTKYAMHAIRLGYQGLELLTQEKLILPMLCADWLKEIRNGKFTLDEVLEVIEHYEKMIKIEEKNTYLPDEPDMDFINAWMNNVYRRYWLYGI